MPEQVCARCGGSGWVIVERADVSGAERCDCAKQARVTQVQETAGIPPLYRRAGFENFKIETDNPTTSRPMSDVFTTVMKYVEKFPLALDKPGLLFVGSPGSGKTHLAVAALRALMQRGFEGVFFDYQTLLDKIRSGYDSASGQTDREAYRAALDAEVLLLDDLGAHRVTDWVEDTVTSIITHRCNNQRPLIATTNLPERTTMTRDPMGNQTVVRRSLSEAVGARAFSRLFEMCTVIRMPAVEDYRQRRAR